MHRTLLLAMLSIAVFALAPCTHAQSADKGNSAASTAHKGMSFEVEIISIDAKGEMHNVANFGQVLPFGKKWGTTLQSKAGDIKVQVTWSGDDQEEPTLLVSLTDTTNKDTAIMASVKLEKVLWDALYGPEAFIIAPDKPFISPSLGRLVAVAAVVPVSE
jgi:hypothetical protein